MLYTCLPLTNAVVHASFLLLDGQIDILLATMPVGAGGCIGGVPNFAPVSTSIHPDASRNKD